MPGPQYSLRLSGGVVKRQRTARQNDSDERLARFGDFGHELLLRARQIQKRARSRLAGENLFLAEKQEHHIGASRRGYGGREAGVAGIAAVLQTGSIDDAPAAERFPQGG